jgi:hypothetical protein
MARWPRLVIGINARATFFEGPMFSPRSLSRFQGFRLNQPSNCLFIHRLAFSRARFS